MATTTRLCDALVARGFPVSDLAPGRFAVLLKFLDDQEIFCLDDFIGASVLVHWFSPV